MLTCYLWNLALVGLVVGIFTMRFFSQKSIGSYSKTTPTIDLRQFFKGTVEGWGVIFDYSGTPKRRFSLNIKGTWTDQNHGFLEELFTYDNGKTLERKWELEFIDDHRFIGKASDVEGQAQGIQMGNAVNSYYTLKIPHKDGFKAVKMNDWIYEVPTGVLLNKVKIKKFGFPVGEMILIMRKKAS